MSDEAGTVCFKSFETTRGETTVVCERAAVEPLNADPSSTLAGEGDPTKASQP